MHPFTTLLADRTALAPRRVEGCLKLLEEGNTIPFIARYRKEQTGGLDEVEIRAIEDGFGQLKELQARKGTILKTLAELDKLTPELERRVTDCWDRTELEDLYLPYKPRRRTRADKAREAGLQALADMILGRVPLPGRKFEVVRTFVNAEGGFATADEALAGARDIVAEELAACSPTRAAARGLAQRTARIVSRKKRGAGEEAAQFQDYFDHEEHLGRIPSHRFLALNRGETEGALSVKLTMDDNRGQSLVHGDFGRQVPAAFTGDFQLAVEDGWKRLLWPALQRELLAATKERADEQAVKVFEENLRALLMTPPMRNQRVLALDPGFRNGCKLAVIDETGKVLDHDTIYPHPPQQQKAAAQRTLERLVQKHRVTLLAVGDGTAHRETLAFLEPLSWPHDVSVEPVREAGASVYSASELAGAELPHLDVSIRGAVSIGRRFQDPLAELVKIDPQALGVGQYQHDVDDKLLARGLEAVVEECVNRVGVELNTASPALLARVAGVGPKLAQAIVDHRDRRGAFATRQGLLDVPGLGPARFTQCAGFLRIRNGREPLDSTAIHPERYGALRSAARKTGAKIVDVLGDQKQAAALGPALMGVDGMGKETVLDILKELVKPGHDPRGEREVFRFAEGIHEVDDLRVGMVLPGRITSVTDFGAFVDVGIHRNGLVHVSKLADHRVASPFEVCRPQQVVRVKVLEVDLKRNRISLSMRPSDLQ